MKIVFIILAVLLALLGLVLFVPVYVTAKYQSGVNIKVQYLCFHYTIPLENQKKKKTNKVTQKSNAAITKENKKQKSKGLFGQLKAQNGILNTVLDLFDFFKTILGHFAKWFKKTTLTKFWLFITVGGQDAAATAMEYGTICAAAYPLIGLLNQQFKIKQQQVNITVDYSLPKTTYCGGVTIRIFAFTAVGTVLNVLKEYVSLTKNANRKDN